MSVANVAVENDTARFSGTLNHASVPMLLKQLKSATFSKIDLQNIDHSNSAGIAMLLELIEQGSDRDQKVVVENLPDQMQRVAELSGVVELL